MPEEPWKPRMLPPMWVAVGIAALFTLHWWLPGPQFVDGKAGIASGIALIASGGLLALWSERQFARGAPV